MSLLGRGICTPYDPSRPTAPGAGGSAPWTPPMARLGGEGPLLSDWQGGWQASCPRSLALGLGSSGIDVGRQHAVAHALDEDVAKPNTHRVESFPRRYLYGQTAGIPAGLISLNGPLMFMFAHTKNTPRPLKESHLPSTHYILTSCCSPQTLPPGAPGRRLPSRRDLHPCPWRPSPRCAHPRRRCRPPWCPTRRPPSRRWRA